MRQDWQKLIEQTVQEEALRNAYVWEPFAKGSSNSIFLGRAKNNLRQQASKTVVLRINAPAKDTPGVVRQRESDILDLIQTHRWAPHIICNEPEQGWCLMSYYEPLELTHAPEHLDNQYQRQLLAALNELQSVEANATDLKYNYHELLDDIYQPIAIRRQDKQAHTWIKSIKQDLTLLPVLPPCLVHHDIHLGNLVLSKTLEPNHPSAQLIILDWEYAAIGNPWFDASCLSRYLSMAPEDIHTLEIFQGVDRDTFNKGLAQANQMTEILQKLWYWARE